MEDGTEDGAVERAGVESDKGCSESGSSSVWISQIERSWGLSGGTYGRRLDTHIWQIGHVGRSVRGEDVLQSAPQSPPVFRNPTYPKLLVVQIERVTLSRKRFLLLDSGPRATCRDSVCQLQSVAPFSDVEKLCLRPRTQRLTRRKA